jgi:hypothetical protein
LLESLDFIGSFRPDGSLSVSDSFVALGSIASPVSFPMDGSLGAFDSFDRYGSITDRGSFA